MKYKDMSLSDFLAAMAKPLPTPTSGSASALCAAQAAALCAKTAGLALKRGHENMQAVVDESLELMTALLHGSQADAEAYAGYLQAKALPDDEGKPAAIEASILLAIDVPMGIASHALRVTELLTLARHHTPKAAVADAQAAVYVAMAAARALLLAARVNTVLLTNKSLKARKQNEIAKLLARVEGA